MSRRLLLLALSACVATLGVIPAAEAAPPKRLYVSLGDSYASGYQPSAVGPGRNSRNGFAYQVPRASCAPTAGERR